MVGISRLNQGLVRGSLFEHFSDHVFPRTAGMGYQAVCSATKKLIRYFGLSGMDELYNLEEDGYELNNLIGVSSSQEQLGEMQVRLDRLLKLSGGKSMSSRTP